MDVCEGGGALGLNYRDTLNSCLQSHVPQAFVGGLGQTWYLVINCNSRDLLYLECGGTLEPWEHCRHLTRDNEERGMRTREHSRGSVLSYDGTNQTTT